MYAIRSYYVLFLPGYECSSNIYAFTGAGLSILDPGNDYTAFQDLFRLGHSYNFV